MKPNNRPGSVAKNCAHTTWNFPGNMENEALVLHAIYPEIPVEKYQLMVKNTCSLIVSLIRNHGYTDGPKRYNVIKNYTISLVEGREPVNPGWLATSEKYRVPSSLGSETIELVVNYLKQLENPAMRDDRCYQAIITLLNIIRKVKGLSDPDYESITQKAKPIDEDLLKRFEAYVSKTLKPYKYTNQPISFSKFSSSIGKKGPNGIPKVESAHMEAIALMKSTLKRPFKGLCSCLEVMHLYNYVADLSGVPLSQEDIPKTAPRKIRKVDDLQINLRVVVPIPDSGCKTRIVAISDFWTQLILEPIRVHVQKVTKILYSGKDFRLDQNAGVASMVRLQEMCMNGEVINGHKFSAENLAFIDASSWTDRFHRDLQKVVMKELFNPSIAEHWAQLVVHCDWYAPKLDRTIKYGQGQGMGTNGSFDIAVLTDHLLINMIYDEDEILGNINFQICPLYGKVGDDLYAYNYEPLLKVYEQINLPINLNKSKLYCKLGSVAEFCSRTFINGVDVSRISPNIISKAKDFKFLPVLIALCHSRGISLPASLFPYLSRKTKSGETYLDKLQPYLLGLFTLMQAEKSTFVSTFNLQQLVEEGWFTNDRYINICHEPLSVTRILLAHSIVTMSDTMKDLLDKRFDIVDGMDIYGDGILEFLKEPDDLYDQDSNTSQYLLQGVFNGQKVLLPKQVIVLERYSTQRALLNSLDYYLELDPESPEETLQMIKEISRACHRCCYNGGDLSYDTEKVFRIQFSITKTLEKLSEDLTVLTLDSDNIRNVLTYVNYDRILQKWPEITPELDSSSMS